MMTYYDTGNRKNVKEIEMKKDVLYLNNYINMINDVVYILNKRYFKNSSNFFS